LGGLFLIEGFEGAANIPLPSVKRQPRILPSGGKNGLQDARAGTEKEVMAVTGL
jgi:hypothetical protein